MTSPRKSEIEKTGSKRWACRRYWGEKSLTSGRWERAPERFEQQEGAVWGECEEAGSHFQSVVKVLRSALGPVESESISQSCPTLCYPIDCNPPSSSVHEILQARILEWVAIHFSRGSSQPRDRTQVSCIAGRFFTVWATREAYMQNPSCEVLGWMNHKLQSRLPGEISTTSVM